MEKNQLIGTWRLVSFEILDTNDRVIHPFGEDAVGYLLYTFDGYMSATLMRAKRSNFAAKDMTGGTIEEQIMAVQTYLSYCGKYEIQGNKVIHHIEASLFPNWVSVEQERFFEFKDNRLFLSTPPILVNGKQQVANLAWEHL